MKTTTPRKNTVQTVLSQDAVRALECIVHWHWDNFDWEALSQRLLKILAVYIESCPKDVHCVESPSNMTDIISSIIELNEQLIIHVQRDEKPWDWVDTINGWELPEQKPQTVPA